jgi:hypothetical protein
MWTQIGGLLAKQNLSLSAYNRWAYGVLMSQVSGTERKGIH